MTRHPLFLPLPSPPSSASAFSPAFLVARNSHRIFSSAASDIEVTGSTSQDFESDLAVWQGQFRRKAMDLKEAYASMKADKEVVRDFLLTRGIPEEDFAFLAIDMEQKFKSVPQFNDDGDLVHREQVFDGYKLTRGFKVTSDDIDLIERISQEVTELIEENVYITSYPPKYFYTQLGELKIQMIAAASADGQTRARTAVEGGGGDLGDPPSKRASASSRSSVPTPTRASAGAARSTPPANTRRPSSTSSSATPSSDRPQSQSCD